MRSSCRAMQLGRTLATFSGPAYVKAGVSQAAIDAQNTGLTNLYKSRVLVGPFSCAATLFTTPTFIDFGNIYTFVGAGTGAVPSKVFRPSEIIPVLR